MGTGGEPCLSKERAFQTGDYQGKGSEVEVCLGQSRGDEESSVTAMECTKEEVLREINAGEGVVHTRLSGCYKNSVGFVLFFQ